MPSQEKPVRWAWSGWATLNVAIAIAGVGAIVWSRIPRGENISLAAALLGALFSIYAWVALQRAGTKLWKRIAVASIGISYAWWAPRISSWGQIAMKLAGDIVSDAGGSLDATLDAQVATALLVAAVPPSIVLGVCLVAICRSWKPFFGAALAGILTAAVGTSIGGSGWLSAVAPGLLGDWFLFGTWHVVTAVALSSWAEGARRSRRAGYSCSMCLYPRAGLAPTAPCPECGAAPQGVAT